MSGARGEIIVWNYSLPSRWTFLYQIIILSLNSININSAANGHYFYIELYLQFSRFITNTLRYLRTTNLSLA